jgi:hypothetical protein
MRLLSRIWPWSTIYRLRQELKEANDRAQMFQNALHEVDPFYWTRKVFDLHAASPRMNVQITGIHSGSGE